MNKYIADVRDAKETYEQKRFLFLKNQITWEELLPYKKDLDKKEKIMRKNQRSVFSSIEKDLKEKYG